MTTTTIGTFTVTHENCEIDQVYETGGLIPHYSDGLILAAATEIERLRAALTITEGEMKERGTDSDTLKTALDFSKQEIGRLRMAAIAHSSDLCEAGRLCAQSDDEYPLAAVQRAVAELAASKDEIERLRSEVKTVKVPIDVDPMILSAARKFEAERDNLKSELAEAVATMDGCIYSAHHRSAMNKRLASKPHAGNGEVGK